MKKQKNYAWLAVFIVFLMAAVPSVLPNALNNTKKEVKKIPVITKPCACVPGIRPPCPISEPLCQMTVSGGNGVCGCPAVKNGLCETHQPTVPKKPGE